LLKFSLLIAVKVILIIFILSPLSLADEGRAINPKAVFEKASRLYSESKFEDAIREYKSISEHGYESGNLYYNLGNCYFKTGLLGYAILYYEKAKRLMPYDSDLRANLKYAYSLVEEPAMERTRIWFVRSIRNFLDSFTINGLTRSLSIIYLSIILFLAVLIFKKSLRRPIINSVVVLSVIFLLTLTLLSINIYRLKYVRSAIILAKEVNVRFEPREDATVHFKLYAGARIQPIKVREGWSQIKREDGKVGWLKTASYGSI
jgi:tetratricopeptide (TPR) repeat protein